MNNHIHAKKSLGQNFLKDPHYLTRIVEAAAVASEDRVLEIGPGQGDLTRLLAARAGAVLAVELDDRLIERLRTEFAGQRNVVIEHADALEYPFESLEGIWKVVANLPYYISTPIIQRLLRFRRTFSSFTLMLQKEVAGRIASAPGGKEYGYLSVLVQFYAQPRLEFLVPPEAFTPRPEVDSTVITLVMRDTPAASVKDEQFFFRVVKAAFSQRRKTLRNSLRRLGLPKEKLDQVLPATGIDLGRRAETLSVQEFANLADNLLNQPRSQ